MQVYSDLKRSYCQYQKHIEIGYLKINFLQKLFLSILFFILIPFSIMAMFFLKNREINRDKNFILRYNNMQPYKTIYSELEKTNKFAFVSFSKIYIPVLPLILFIDIAKEFIRYPKFVLLNLAFFGALSWKISRYYFLIRSNNISNLVVLQEYSFYMSYLTRIMEHENGNLYNIMHGIPGRTYCFFRFTKCFVWGENFKKKYIEYGAEPTQFIVSGSIFHSSILEKINESNNEDIDILYTMAGKMNGYVDVLNTLEKLSSKYKIRIKQHPRHKIVINQNLIEVEDDIIDCIINSKIVVGHYTTALLDSIVLNKTVVSYLEKNSPEIKYVDYLNDSQILHEENQLLSYLENALSGDCNKVNLDNKYIDRTKNPIKVIINEIC